MHQTHATIQFIKVTRIEQFAEQLKQRSQCTLEDERYIDWIWLDVMIKHFKKEPRFDSLGFDVLQHAQLAGAQILALMQNAYYRDTQPLWLRSYRLRRTTLLTSFDIQSEWKAEVDEGVRDDQRTFSAITKKLIFGTSIVEPDQTLKEHLTERIALITQELAAISTAKAGGAT